MPSMRTPRRWRGNRRCVIVRSPSPVPAAEMIVRSLFFAQYRDFAGADEMAVELPEGASVADLVVRLRGGEGGLSRLPAAPVVAVNMDYAPHSTALREGDEV